MAGNPGPLSTALGVEKTFRVRDVFDKSFSVFGRHFVVFTTLAAIVLSPFYLTLFAGALLMPDGDPGYLVLAALTVMPMLVIGPTIASGVMTYGVVQDFSGRPVQILETLNVLVRNLRPMIGISVALLLLVPAGLLLTLIASVFESIVIEPPYQAVSFALLLILGYSIYFAAAPACIAERAGIGVSLSRSRFLTKGHRLQISGAFILVFGFNAVVSVMAAIVASRVGAGNTERLIASYMVQVVFLAFTAVLAAVSYYQLRLANDGSDVASVFD